MPEQSAPLRQKPFAARMTNLLAGGWAVLAFNLIMRSLFVTHQARPFLVALIPLLAVWATFERKRWGRLALVGVSLTALGLFLIASGMALIISTDVYPPSLRDPAHYALQALWIYSQDPSTLVILPGLSIITGIWLSRSVVIAEFDRNKRSVLARGQFAIATALVAFWGFTVVFAPLALGERMAEPAKSYLRHTPRASVSSRIIRSEALTSKP